MKVFITGGTGFVGSHLTRELTASGGEVVVLTRSEKADRQLPAGASYVVGDPNFPGPWQEKAADCDTLINLAGASIFTYWSAKAKQTIRDSRVMTTRNLVDALADRKGKDTLLVSASAVGYYGAHDDDAMLDEESPAGNDFLGELSRDWEAEARRAEPFGVRVAICRFGIVLGKRGGALGKMVPAFKYGFGSALGSGKQWFSWIHEKDLARAVLYVTERNTLSGALNCTAPFPVTNKEMAKSLAQALHMPLIMPAAPGFLVRTVLGEFGNVLLKGQRVVPARLLSAGFQFQFPTMQEALQDLLGP
jgi:uncharacterized protein